MRPRWRLPLAAAMTDPVEKVSSMSRALLVLTVLTGFLGLAGMASAQAREKTVRLEVWVPENARLFIEGKEMRTTGAMCIFDSQPLPQGKYTYTLKAVVPGP